MKINIFGYTLAFYKTLQTDREKLLSKIKDNRLNVVYVGRLVAMYREIGNIEKLYTAKEQLEADRIELRKNQIRLEVLDEVNSLNP